MPIRKIAQIIDAASKDASRARSMGTSGEFKKKLGQDRRGALSEFTTVKHALRDRERIEAQKSEKSAKPASKAGTRKNGKRK